MELRITNLLYGELVWNKEQVVIKLEDDDGTVTLSEMKRLEFHYDAIDHDYKVELIEPYHDEDSDRPYLLLTCVR